MMSSVSPVMAIPQPSPTDSPSITSINRDRLSTQYTHSASASSGFAGLSRAPTLPFSAINVSSGTSKPRPHEALGDDAECKDLLGKEMKPTDDSKRGAAQPAMGFGTLGSSSSTILGLSSFNSLGSAAFGSGFGQALNGGTKLSSFAAPVGDAKWGGQDGLTNLFGAQAKEEEEEDISGSEDCGFVDTEQNEESGEVDGRFQQQDGKAYPLLPLLEC